MPRPPLRKKCGPRLVSVWTCQRHAKGLSSFEAQVNTCWLYPRHLDALRWNIQRDQRPSKTMSTIKLLKDMSSSSNLIASVAVSFLHVAWVLPLSKNGSSPRHCLWQSPSGAVNSNARPAGPVQCLALKVAQRIRARRCEW